MLTCSGQTFHNVLGVAVQQLFITASHARNVRHCKFSLEVRAVNPSADLFAWCKRPWAPSPELTTWTGSNRKTDTKTPL